MFVIKISSVTVSDTNRPLGSQTNDSKLFKFAPKETLDLFEFWSLSYISVRFGAMKKKSKCYETREHWSEPNTPDHKA